MTSASPDPREEGVRREAAGWFARMRGPEADRHRAAFEAWQSSDPAHAGAYERMVHNWDRSAFIASSEVARNRDLGRIAPRPAARRRALAASILALSLVSVSALWFTETRELSARTLEMTVVATDQPKVIALDDDTRVTVAPRSSLDLAFSPQARHALLRRGSARFHVPRADPRPLVVAAGPGRITASEATFEVVLAEEGAQVTAISGSVAAGIADGRRQSLEPGEKVFVPSPRRDSHRPSTAATTPGMVVFDGETVARAIARFNLTSPRPVEVADPLMAQSRVSGAFQTEDARGFAQALAVMFDGRVMTGPRGQLVIASKAGAKK